MPGSIQGDLDTLFNQLEGIDYLDFIHCVNFNPTEPYNYKKYTIPKPNGQKRPVEEPKGYLKEIQKALIPIFEQFPLTGCCYSKKGSSAIDHAGHHHGTGDVVVKMDIKKFYPNVKFENFEYALNKTHHAFLSDELREILLTAAQFCFIRKGGSLVLPTGSPTSPIIANIVATPLDNELNGLAYTSNMQYTRYMDDLIFSGNHYPSGLQKNVNTIVKNYGFHINHEKSKILYRNNDQQCITGVVINGNGIPKSYKRNLRAILDLYARENLPLDAELRGKLAYVKSVDNSLYNYFQKYFLKRQKRYQDLGK